jgi:hypothetical protein
VTLVDTNVILDIWADDPEWGQWSADAFERAVSHGVVVVNPIIVSELARRFGSEGELTDALSNTRLRRIPLPAAVAWPAARAFAEYQARGGARTSPLSDFYIGAHALVEDWPILTRDPKPYRTYFPKVKLIAPRNR